MKNYQYYVYILASKKNGTLYTGVTSDLISRVFQHKKSLEDGFTKKYKIYNLVYYEIYNDIREAIYHEKNKEMVSRMENTFDREEKPSME